MGVGVYGCGCVRVWVCKGVGVGECGCVWVWVSICLGMCVGLCVWTCICVGVGVGVYVCGCPGRWASGMGPGWDGLGFEPNAFRSRIRRSTAELSKHIKGTKERRLLGQNKLQN